MQLYIFRFANCKKKTAKSVIHESVVKGEKGEGCTRWGAVKPRNKLGFGGLCLSRRSQVSLC